jgi:hypothetical protein
MPTALTIPMGATAAEARQQLVLRTFASTSGDAVRTGKVLGLSEQEVRTEMLSLLKGSGGSGGSGSGASAKESNGTASAAAPAKAAKAPPAPSRGAAKKSTAKKGR